MTTSGTYNFNPAASDVFIAAFALCGLRRTQVVAEHIADASFQANLLMVDFSNRNPNQWGLETQSVILIPGQAAYALSPRTIAVAVAYIETTSGTAITGRVLGRMSASEYAAVPNKLQTGFPSSYVMTLTTPNPTLTLYLVPDSSFTYTLQLQTFRQMQDISVAGGQTLDAPYRFLDAFTYGLASRLALIYAPDRFQMLKGEYEEKFLLAAEQDQEAVNLYISPGLGGYFR
jgi:hypothetical protein